LTAGDWFGEVAFLQDDRYADGFFTFTVRHAPPPQPAVARVWNIYDSHIYIYIYRYLSLFLSLSLTPTVSCAGAVPVRDLVHDAVVIIRNARELLSLYIAVCVYMYIYISLSFTLSLSSAGGTAPARARYHS